MDFHRNPCQLRFNDTVEKRGGVTVSECGKSLWPATPHIMSPFAVTGTKEIYSANSWEKWELCPFTYQLSRIRWDILNGIFFFLCIFLKSIMRTATDISRTFRGCMDTENRHSSRSFIVLCKCSCDFSYEEIYCSFHLPTQGLCILIIGLGLCKYQLTSDLLFS